MIDGKTAGIFTVVLATAGLSACGSTVDGSGGSTGTTTGATTGTGGTGGTVITTGYGGAVDPAPAPLDCTTVKDGQMFGPTASLAGSTLTVTLAFKDYVEGASQWSAAPQVTADFGTVDKVELQGTTVVVSVTVASGSTGGALAFHGDLADYYGATCSVARNFTVGLGSSGATIARLDPMDLPLGPRPNLVLTLVGSEGLKARVRASGVPEGARVELDATGGVASRDGEQLEWALPPEPGLYQLEVVVRRDGAIATSALVVEVKGGRG